MSHPAADIFADSRGAFRSIAQIASDLGVGGGSPAGDAVAVLTGAIDEPVTAFTSPPQFVRSDLDARPAVAGPAAQSGHAFFDVVRARASRRDFAERPMPLDRLLGLLTWTVGQRGETVAYDYRGAPTRFVPSAGGLNTVDAYVLAHRVESLPCGAYYFDLRRGLVHIADAVSLPHLAASSPGQEWVAEASALVVFVANLDRAARKYGVMASKLAMFDGGVVAGHMELVAAALELRASLLGGIPPVRLGQALGLVDDDQLPLLSLAVGMRPE